MSNINPYASPPAPVFAQMPPQPPVAVYRQGDFVVMHRGAQLPAICYFSGEPASADSMPVSLKYDEPWVRAMAVMGWLWYAIISSMVSKSVNIKVPVSQKTWDSRWWWTWLCWGLFGVGLAAFILGCVLLGNRTLEAVGGFLMIASLLTMIAAPIVGFFAFGRVDCHYMDDQFIWMTGAHASFLAVLPHWPFPPR